MHGRMRPRGVDEPDYLGRVGEPNLTILEPGSRNLTDIRRTLTRAGWSETDPQGFEYMLERDGERVYALSCGFIAHVGTGEDWVDPILDAYGEGWKEKRPLPDGMSATVAAALADIILDKVGRKPYIPAGATARDIDEFDRRNRRMRESADSLKRMFEGRCTPPEVIDLDERLSRAREGLIRGHEHENRRAMGRLQLLAGIVAACDVGQFFLALADPGADPFGRIIGGVLSMVLFLYVIHTMREYRE